MRTRRFFPFIVVQSKRADMSVDLEKKVGGVGGDSVVFMEDFRWTKEFGECSYEDEMIEVYFYIRKVGNFLVLDGGGLFRKTSVSLNLLCCVRSSMLGIYVMLWGSRNIGRCCLW